MLTKKYRKSGSILLTIFLISVILVIGVIVYAYILGIRYIKANTNAKFFGFVDKNGDINRGKFWLDDGTVVSIEPQNVYIVEIKNPQSENFEELTLALNSINFTEGENRLETLNNAIPPEILDLYPMKHFIFNGTNDGVSFYSGNLQSLLKRYDVQKNPLISGTFKTQDGTEWVLFSTKTNSASYKDFSIVRANDKSKQYKGDIFAFAAKEQIFFASLEFKAGNIANLYPAPKIFRYDVDQGNNNNDIYIGQIKNNLQKNGKGIYYYYATGDICYGDFVSDAKTGKFKVLYADGGSYDGDLVDSIMDGEGVYKFSDGTEYSGGLQNNMKHGRGILTSPDGAVYEGDYFEDTKHGEGTYKFANGDTYAGSYESDVFSGRGKYIWASGEYYEGEFRNNLIYGEGTYHWLSGRTYTGYFENGKMTLTKPE